MKFGIYTTHDLPDRKCLQSIIKCSIETHWKHKPINQLARGHIFQVWGQKKPEPCSKVNVHFALTFLFVMKDLISVLDRKGMASS